MKKLIQLDQTNGKITERKQSFQKNNIFERTSELNFN